MPTHLLITAFGPDRPGIVSELSNIISLHGGNVEESRMTNLGNEFAILLLAKIQNNQLDSLKNQFKEFKGLSIYTKSTMSKIAIDGIECVIYLVGADHEGIIAGLAKYLSKNAINIYEMITNTTHAPSTGTILFNMQANITLPNNINFDKIKSELKHIANDLGVDIKIEKLD
tara:strand:- start:3623 stop:4138 length:516 start_codon:yes stop_codon:yes gene_type:complete